MLADEDSIYANGIGQMNRSLLQSTGRPALPVLLLLLTAVCWRGLALAQVGDPVARIEREIDALLQARKETPGRQENIEKTWVLIEDISEIQEPYPIESARLLLLLYQYSGAEDGHVLGDMLMIDFHDDPARIVSALIGIERHLRPEFRNEGFLQFLYYNCCYYPVALTEIEEGFDFAQEDRAMRERLEAIRNSENDAIVSYLVTDLYNSP